MKPKSGEEPRKVFTRGFANDQANKELVALMRAQQNALSARASALPKNATSSGAAAGAALPQRPTSEATNPKAAK